MANESMSGSALITPMAGGGSDGGTTAIAFNRGSIKYDSPFLDMTSTFLPKTIKSILKFVSQHIMSDGFVAQCITKMSEYPITDLIYSDIDNKLIIKDDRTVDKWKEILEKGMKLIRCLKQAGMDYYGYGNSVSSINYPFKRILICPRCGTKHTADGLSYKFKNFQFEADCASKDCKFSGVMEAKDIATKEVKKFSIVFWGLNELDIKYNPITGDHFYYVSIPTDMANAVRRGDKDIINSTRLEVIHAISKKKQLKLMPDNVFHLKRAAPQYLISSERGWGIPAVMPVMKEVFHCKILKKGNEMIAFDHIVPFRVLYPNAVGDVSPHATINLSKWKTKIEEEIRKWRADPNYISIMPIPLGVENLSGDAKMLNVTPELRAVQDEVITGMGIIPEIIRGGASWSGSNVSLRVVENTFLNHRADMQEFIEFIIDNVSRYMDIPKISVKMSDFKMADDLAKKQLMVQAGSGPAESKFISRDTVTKELGFDPVKEYDTIKKELDKTIELRIREAEGNAEAQGSSGIINALYSADAQIENQTRMETNQREGQQKRDGFIAQQKDSNSAAVMEEATNLAQSKGVDPNVISIPNLILTLTNRFARLARVDVDEFKFRMLVMKNSTPMLYGEIYNNLKEMNLIEADTMPNLALAQKYTPGEMPTYTQGDTTAEETPTPIEQGAAATPNLEIGTGGTLPEVAPPRGGTTSI